jgi:chromosome segregation ATPase
MTNLHQLQLCCNELEAEVGQDVMSQRAIENALQRRVEILKASLGSLNAEMLALTTNKEEQVEQLSKTMRVLEAELVVRRGKGGKVDYLEQIIRGLQTEVTEERKGRMGAEQEVGNLQESTRILQEEHTRALQALQANTRAHIVRLEQKVGASDAITRSKADKVDQLEQTLKSGCCRQRWLMRRGNGLGRKRRSGNCRRRYVCCRRWCRRLMLVLAWLLKSSWRNHLQVSCVESFLGFRGCLQRGRRN